MVLAIVGTVAVYFAVNTVFSKVTQTISESDLMQNENQEVELPVLSEGGQTGEKIQADMNAENMKKLESKISFADKFAVLTLLASALPSEKYSELMAMTSGGVTQEEISEAYQILRENLTPEQKDQVKQYYGKYLHLLEE